MDASHFVWQGFVGFLWCFTKIWLGSPCGRKRFSVLGALNAVTLEVLVVCTNGTIDSWSVVDMLWKFRKRYRKTGIPVSIVLDNARYQRCYLVQFAARLMNIELIFLPPYSPNLNLIERFWKLVKKKCLASKTYDSFEEFSLAIQSFIERAHLECPDELASLLTLKFQTLPEKVHRAA